MPFGHKPPRYGEDLELMRTKLSVVDGELQRLNSDDRMLLRLPLREIERIRARRKIDWPVFLFAATGAGMGVVAWYFSEYNVLSVILYVIAVLLVGFGTLGSIAVQIDVTTRDGTTAILCIDNLDECQCFVVSVQQMVRESKSPKRPDEPDQGGTAIRDAT